MTYTMETNVTIKPKELLKFNLFSGLSEDEIKVLLPYLHPLYLSAGQILTQEHQSADYMYLVEKGSLEVFKNDSETGQQHTIATLSKDSVIGEMALVDSQPRSASVRAIETATLYAISIQDIKKLSKKHLEVYTRILENTGKEISTRLRYTNEVTISALTRQMRMGHFLITTIIVLCLYAFLLKFMPDLVRKTHNDVTQSLIILISVVFPVLYYIKFRKYSMSKNWFNTHHWQKNIAEVVIYTLPILALVVAFKAYLIYKLPQLPHQQLFNGPFIHSITPKFLIFLCIYLLGCPIQEFIVRGILQESLQIFLTGPFVVLRSILVSNIFYSTIHFYLPMTYTLAALLFGFYLGWLYSKQKTLLGVTVAHAIIGVWVIYIVGVNSIFYA